MNSLSFKTNFGWISIFEEQNKISLTIPCHRVVRSDGGVGVFSGVGGSIFKKKY